MFRAVFNFEDKRSVVIFFSLENFLVWTPLDVVRKFVNVSRHYKDVVHFCFVRSSVLSGVYLGPLEKKIEGELTSALSVPSRRCFVHEGHLGSLVYLTTRGGFSRRVYS